MTRVKQCLILAAAVLLAVPAWAESVWVKNDNVDVRDGKGALASPVARVQKGTELQVVSRDGKWLQVQAPGGVTGWIHENSLSPQKVNGDVFSGMNNGAAGVNTSAAARGLRPETEQYAASRNLSKAPLEHLISLKKTINAQELQAFEQAISAGTR